MNHVPDIELVQAWINSLRFVVCKPCVNIVMTAEIGTFTRLRKNLDVEIFLENQTI